MKYFILTLGCQQNVHDAERLKVLLDKVGLQSTDEKSADLIFILACSVRQSAVNRIFGKVKSWNSKEKFISACILPTDKVKLIEKGFRIFDIDDLNSLKNTLDLKIGGDLNLLADSQNDSAYLPIMTGCDNFCSYCAVPYTRGREKSRSAEAVIADFNRLLKSGHKEITLLGQNANSYCGAVSSKSCIYVTQDSDPESCMNFSQLLKTLDSIPGNFTIKFLSNHPKDMSDELIDSIARLPKVAKEIHLPLQSGSTKILKKMNRHYTKNQYFSLVRNLKLKIENLKLSTDIIVGFPGETDKDFNDTVEVCKKVKFSVAFIAKYSPRSGTIASKLKDDVPLEIKKQRFRQLDQLINSKP